MCNSKKSAFFSWILQPGNVTLLLSENSVAKGSIAFCFRPYVLFFLKPLFACGKTRPDSLLFLQQIDPDVMFSEPSQEKLRRRLPELSMSLFLFLTFFARSPVMAQNSVSTKLI